MKKQFQAVLWDVDNTIIMSGSTHDCSVLAALNEFTPIKYQINKAHELDILARAWDESWFNCGGQPELLNAFEDRVAALYMENIHHLEPRIGAVEVLRLIHSLHIPQAVVSNSKRLIVEANLRQVGIDDIIEKRICREDFSSPKPEPDPYLKAAESVSVPIKDCIAVEDSLRGVLSAKKAGATVVYWPHKPVNDNGKCDYLVSDIQNLNWKDFFNLRLNGEDHVTRNAN